MNDEQMPASYRDALRAGHAAGQAAGDAWAVQAEAELWKLERDGTDEVRAAWHAYDDVWRARVRRHMPALAAALDALTNPRPHQRGSGEPEAAPTCACCHRAWHRGYVEGFSTRGHRDRARAETATTRLRVGYPTPLVAAWTELGPRQRQVIGADMTALATALDALAPNAATSPA